MRFVLQKVSRARVEVDGSVVGRIGPGLLVLAGFGRGDGETLPEGKPWRAMLEKTLDLRIFPDEAGRMNLSLRDVGGDLLLVSQFTLYADTRKGRRPSFTGAAAPDLAEGLFRRLVRDFSALAPGAVATGEFGALMDVHLVNSGPVTIVLDAADFA